MKKIAVVLVSILISACAATPKTDTSQNTQPNEAAKNSTVAASTGVTGKNSAVSSASLDSGNGASESQAMQNKSVYFDFDKYIVKPEFHDVIKQQAELIKNNKKIIVTLEGNADERGSNEYNLALGNKRANAVRKSLEQLGVSATQIKTISLGEENPRLKCHEEDCWKENRRNDFVHNLN